MTGPVRGVLFMVLASALVAMTTVFAKILGTGENALSPFQISWGRYTFAMLSLLVVALILRPRLAKFHIGLHTARVSFGVAGVTAMFAAATLIPLADATAISFLNPIIAMILAVLFLAEKAGPVRWLMAACAFGGALLLIRPGSSAFQPAALIALLAALLIGIEVTIVKRLSGKEPMFQILMVSNVAGTAITSVLVLFVWEPPTAHQWMMLVGLGMIMLCAQGLYIPALKSGDASFVVPFSYSTLLFAGFYDLLLFDIVPVPLSLAGGLVILISGIILAWREGRSRKLRL